MVHPAWSQTLCSKSDISSGRTGSLMIAERLSAKVLLLLLTQLLSFGEVCLPDGGDIVANIIVSLRVIQPRVVISGSGGCLVLQ